MTGAVAAASLTAAPAAFAGLQQEFAIFSDCPVNAPGVTACIVGNTTSGDFQLGSKTVPINKTITLQGGLTLTSRQLVPAADGNTLSNTPLELPGGLIGIELLPPLTSVTATAELAAPITVDLTNFGQRTGTAVSLPVKVKLSNPFLGGACYVGSSSTPVDIQLTSGTTSPPPPAKPISGSVGTSMLVADGKIAVVSGASLVDNSFSAAGANGCGGLLSLFIDPGVDLIAGLPAPAGRNAAILNSTFESASAPIVKAEAALPQLGRCEKVAGVKEGTTTVFHGGYSEAGCVAEATEHKGKFEWSPGPGAGRKFTAASAAVTLQTTGKAQVKCTSSTAAGEYTAAKTATLVATFDGCTSSVTKETCQSSGAAPGEVVTGSLAGELGFITDAVQEGSLKASVGLDLKREPAVLSAECGASKQSLVVSGSVIAPITPLDKMTGTSKLSFTAAEGRQKPEQLEAGPRDTLSAKFGAGAGEQAGLTAKSTLTDEEHLEVKAQAE